MLVEFLLRLAFGMAAAMACVSPRQVTSGYYRNNLYVLLGLTAAAATVAWMGGAEWVAVRWPATLGALLSYAGAVAWLYDRPRAGWVLLVLVGLLALTAAWVVPLERAASAAANVPQAARVLRALEPVLAGLLVGTVTAGMLLGHWYLNAPGMPLAPLFRVTALLGAAVLLRTLAAAGGLAGELASASGFTGVQWSLLALRWLSALLATAVLVGMTWQTLRIPNTQSATGILYVAVITVFLGELTAQLLSGQTVFPL